MRKLGRGNAASVGAELVPDCRMNAGIDVVGMIAVDMRELGEKNSGMYHLTSAPVHIRMYVPG